MEVINILKFLWSILCSGYVTLILMVIIILLLYLYNKSIKREVALQQNEQMLKTVINSSPDIICYKDGDGKWIEANEAMINIYNSKIPIVGKNNSELKELIPEFIEEFNACEITDNYVWENGKTTMVQENFHKPDGTIRTFDVFKVPLFYEDGKRKGLVVIGRDVTEVKKAKENDRLVQELKNYNEIRTEFFANLSHELRTPLNLILSPLQLLQIIIKNNIKGEVEAKLQNYINIIRQNSYRLMKIVNNLIDITKADAGYLGLCLQNVNIIEVIENITLSTKSYVEEKGLTIIFDTEVEEKIISCDLDKIERIMLNLLSNAVKFTPKGGRIEVSIQDKINNIEISIKDTGIGIPKEKHKIIFERFMQVDKSLSRSKEGCGIGLSLVKAFVEMHGGTVSIDSEYNLGSNFILNIPVKVLSLSDEASKECCCTVEDDKVQIINIEFSDIYS